MTPTQYIHVRNWDRYQHPDTRRHERSVPWIKSYTQQLSELPYLLLSYADRGLLESLRLQYALNRAEGVQNQRGSLARLLGVTPRPEQIERLNQAGFLVISACETLADGLPPASLDSDSDTDTDADIDITGALTEARPAPNGPDDELSIRRDIRRSLGLEPAEGAL